MNGSDGFLRLNATSRPDIPTPQYCKILSESAEGIVAECYNSTRNALLLTYLRRSESDFDILQPEITENSEN